MPKFRGMNYSVWGEGAPIVLLHGWGADSTIFRQIAEILCLNYKVYLIDFWGFGQSEQVDLNADIYTYADGIEAFLREIVQQDAIVLGHSFGGRVGILLGARKLVKALVLVDSAGLKPRFSIARYLKIKRYKLIKKKASLNARYQDKLLNFGSQDYLAMPIEIRQVFVRVVNEDLAQNCREITCKTLLLWGKKDKDTPMYMAKKLKRLIPGAKLTVLQGGHYSFLDSPQEFCKELYNFLENVENV